MTPALGDLLTQARSRRAKDAPLYADIAHCAYTAGIDPARLLDIERGCLRPSGAELMSLCVALCVIGRNFSELMDAYGRPADVA